METKPSKQHMMKERIIQEKKGKDSYQVCYFSEPNVFKIVRYYPMGECVPEKLKDAFVAILEIQHSGLEGKVEGVELWGGNRCFVSGHYPLAQSTDFEKEQAFKESIRIARKFKGIFSTNKQLSEHIDYFRALKKYLK